MSPEVSKSTALDLRAFIVIAALICLCISSNVGLQFFPLPAATTQAAVDVQQDQANKATRAPQADAQSFRVPMMVQSTKRADKEPPQSNPLIALLAGEFGLPEYTGFAIEIGYPVCFLASVKMAPHTGRAPPSSAA